MNTEVWFESFEKTLQLSKIDFKKYTKYIFNPDLNLELIILVFGPCLLHIQRISKPWDYSPARYGYF